MLVVVLRLSLVVASRVCCLLQCTGFSIAVASLIVEHGLWVCGFQQLRHTASVFVACRLQGAQASVIMAYRFSCSLASGIFPDQGLNIGRWTVNYWTTREVLLSLFFSAIYLQEKFDQTFDQICRISYSVWLSHPCCIFPWSSSSFSLGNGIQRPPYGHERYSLLLNYHCFVDFSE